MSTVYLKTGSETTPVLSFRSREAARIFIKSSQKLYPKGELMTKPRILVVDDDAGIRFVLECSLARLGWDVTLAEDGAAGLQLWKTGDFDAISTDLNMPNLTGLGLAEKVLAAKPAFPIFMFTGGNGGQDDETAQKFLALGGRGFFEKPNHKPYIAALAAALKEVA